MSHELLSASDNFVLTASLSGSRRRNGPDIQETFSGEVFTAVSPHLNSHTIVTFSYRDRPWILLLVTDVLLPGK